MEADLDLKNFVKWIGKIYATKERELDCEQIQWLLPAYVDTKLNISLIKSTEFHQLITDVKTHLSQCPDCKETYRGLWYIAQLEVDDGILMIDEDIEDVSPETEVDELAPVTPVTMP